MVLFPFLLFNIELGKMQLKVKKIIDINMRCPNCGKELKENGVKLVETDAEVIYDVFLDGKGELQFEQTDIESGNGDTILCCGNCGAELGDFSEETAKKFLQ